MAIRRKHAVLSAELLVLDASLSLMTISCAQSNPLSCPLAHDHIYTYIILSLLTVRIRYPNTVHRAYANTNSLDAH